MPKRVIEQERVKRYSPSQIFHAMRGAGSTKAARLHAVYDILPAGRKDIVTG